MSTCGHKVATAKKIASVLLEVHEAVEPRCSPLIKLKENFLLACDTCRHELNKKHKLEECRRNTKRSIGECSIKSMFQTS